MTTQGHAEPALVRPVHFPPHQGSRPPLFFVVGALLNALAVLHYIHDYDDVDFDGLARRASAASIAPRAAAKALDDLSLAVSSFSEARSFFDFAPGARLVRSARGLDAMQLSLEAGDVHTKTEGARLVWLVSERAVDARAMMRSRPDVASACLRLWRACLSDKALFCVDCGSPPEAIDLVMAAVLNLLAAGAFPAALDVELAGLMRDTAALVASGASFEPLLALADGHDAAWANEMALTLAKMCNAAPTAAAQGCAATLASAVAKSGSWVDVEARARLAAWRAGGLVQRAKLWMLDCMDGLASVLTALVGGWAWASLRTAFALRGVGDAHWRHAMASQYGRRAAAAAALCVAAGRVDSDVLWPRAEAESAAAQKTLLAAKAAAQTAGALALIRLAPYSLVPVLLATPTAPEATLQKWQWDSSAPSPPPPTQEHEA